MPMPVPSEDRNPMMDDAGTHVATARLMFNGGVLHQLFWPADMAAHDPEWRPVPEWVEPVEPAPEG